jgi:hypothetical protein
MESIYRFTLDMEQEKRLDTWKENIKPMDVGAIGGEYTYCFTPTSLGIICVVKHASGQEINLTNFDEW